MKVITVIGARPQFVKAATVSRAFAQQGGIEEIIVHTGQHFDSNMSDVFFDEMQIPRPDYHFDIHSLSHGAMTGRMLERIEEVWLKERPNFTLVYGDTNSTLAGALAAKKQQGRVVHVESGLRSFNMKMPEEINRILTDRISDILFCPTSTAMENLRREGFGQFDCEALQSGDVMEDAALFYAGIAAARSTILHQLNLEGKKYLLCTVHRAENTDELCRLKNIVEAINKLAKNCPVILPLHPRTRKIMEQNFLRVEATLLPPVGYFDMLQLLRNSSLVLTDSGGLQKEAYFFERFCVTLREETEWTELIEGGFNVIAGANREQILSAVQSFENKPFVKEKNLYGGGNAAHFIARHLYSKA